MKWKKILCLFVLFILIFTLTSCKKEYKRIKQLDYDEIFSKDGMYYVFIYMNDCAICAQIEEQVYDYYVMAKRNDDYPNLYVINRSKKANYDALTGNCPGDDYSNLIGCTDYKDIKVCTSPVMLKIRHKIIKEVFDTRSSIKEELSKWGNENE